MKITRGKCFDDEDDDAVTSLEAHDRSITAGVKGTRLYDTKVEFAEDDCRFSCSFPFDGAGLCKHCVALAIAVLERPDLIGRINANLTGMESADNVDELIERADSERIKRFIREAAQGDPGLLDKFKTIVHGQKNRESKETVDALRDRVREALESFDLSDYERYYERVAYYSDKKGEKNDFRFKVKPLTGFLSALAQDKESAAYIGGKLKQFRLDPEERFHPRGAKGGLSLGGSVGALPVRKDGARGRTGPLQKDSFSTRRKHTEDRRVSENQTGLREKSRGGVPSPHRKRDGAKPILHQSAKIEKLLQEQTGRNAYAMAASWVKNLHSIENPEIKKKIGSFTDSLLARHSRRPALKDEFRKKGLL